MTNFLAEIIGTALLIIFGNGVVGGVVLQESKAKDSGWIVITFGWGFAVAFAVYAVGSYSGAHINPAVTLSLASIGALPWADVPAYIAGQVLGAFIGATVVWVHYLPHWKKTDDQDGKLACFSTAPAIRSVWANLLSELIGTFILMIGLLTIGANEFSQGLNPLIVGFLIVSIGLSLGGTTGYAINPARDLGPRIAHFLLPITGKRDSDWGYSWIPIVGPVIGGVYGALFYQKIFKQNGSWVFWAMTILVLAIVAISVLQQIKNDKNE